MSEAVRTVEDTELRESLVDLGPIYRVEVDGHRAAVDLTLTDSGCPARELIPADVEDAPRGGPVRCPHYGSTETTVGVWEESSICRVFYCAD